MLDSLQDLVMFILSANKVSLTLTSHYILSNKTKLKELVSAKGLKQDQTQSLLINESFFFL